MLSSSLLSEVLEETKKITSMDILVAEDNGTVLASTRKLSENESRMLATFALSDKSCYEDRGMYLLRDSYDRGDIDFILMLLGDGKERGMVAGLVTMQVKLAIKGNESRAPVNDLLSNLLLDNILHTNIESEANYLGLDPLEKRRVFIAQAETGRESALLTKAHNIFAGRPETYVVSVERGKTAIISGDMSDEIALIKAKEIFDRLGGSENGVLRVGIGLSVDNLEDLINSYRQAVSALAVADLFKPEEEVASYDRLGAGRIINVLPEDICSAFISENFAKGEIDGIDKEILYTVKVFFENSLNISETARKMFIHRNTLIYRLNKLYNQIGLDVRNFDDAMTFKLTDMVNKRLKLLKNKQAGRIKEKE